MLIVFLLQLDLEKIEMNLILLNNDSEKLLQNKEIIIEQKIEDATSSSAIASLLNNNVYKIDVLQLKKIFFLKNKN